MTYTDQVTLAAQYLATLKPVMWRGTPLTSLIADARRWHHVHGGKSSWHTVISDQAMIDAAEGLELAVTQEGVITFISAVARTGSGWAKLARPKR